MYKRVPFRFGISLFPVILILLVAQGCIVPPAGFSEASNEVQSQFATDPTPTNLPAEQVPTPTLISDERLDSEPSLTSTTSLSPSVRVNATLRSGPGTEYSIVGGRAKGTLIKAVAQTTDGLWLLLESGNWIKASQVNDVPRDLPVVQFIPPTPTVVAPSPTPTATPAVPSPTPTPGPVVVVLKPQADSPTQKQESAPIFPIQFSSQTSLAGGG